MAAISGSARRSRPSRSRPWRKTLGLKLEQVRIHNHLLGGGFGRRLEFDFIVQAALIAKQVERSGQGRVEPRGGHPARHVPAVLLRPHLAPASTSKGMPVAWSHRIVGSSIMARFFPPSFKDGIDPDAVDGAIDMPYDHRRTSASNTCARSLPAFRPRSGAASALRTTSM